MTPKQKKLLIAVAVALVTFLGLRFGVDKSFTDQAIQLIKEQDETDTGMVPVVEEQPEEQPAPIVIE